MIVFFTKKKHFSPNYFFNEVKKKKLYFRNRSFRFNSIYKININIKYMSSSVSYKPLLRTEQRRRQQRSNEAQHQIHLTLFASNFHHPHHFASFHVLSVSLWSMSWTTLKESTCRGVSEWTTCFVLQDGEATRTGSKLFSSCTFMPPRWGHFHIPLNFNFPPSSSSSSFPLWILIV